MSAPIAGRQFRLLAPDDHLPILDQNEIAHRDGNRNFMAILEVVWSEADRMEYEHPSFVVAIDGQTCLNAIDRSARIEVRPSHPCATLTDPYSRDIHQMSGAPRISTAPLVASRLKSQAFHPRRSWRSAGAPPTRLCAIYFVQGRSVGHGTGAGGRA